MADEIERAPATLERCLDALGGELRRNADPDALVRGHVGLYGMSTFTDELALAAKRCADENGVVLTLHQNFEPADTEADDKRFGRPAVEHLNELGILGPSTHARAHERAPRRRDRRPGGHRIGGRLASRQLPLLRDRERGAVPDAGARRARASRSAS